MELSNRDAGRRWYVIHTYSGYENKVKVNLEKKIESQNLQDKIFNVVIPLESEVEEVDGKERVVKRKLFPGYVMVEMIVDNYSWYIVRNTEGVTGFVGTEKDPIPLSDEEAAKILAGVAAKAAVAVGDEVVVTDEWLKGKRGTVQEIDAENNRAKVEIDGTPIDIELTLLEKA